MANCPLMKPILSEWLALSNQSFNDWKRVPTPVLQLFSVQFDTFTNQLWVKLLDGNVLFNSNFRNKYFTQFKAPYEVI